jgi:hypothetical protein
MADITRDQFDESNKVAYKIFQKDTAAMDADFNEQIQIARYDRMRALSAMVNHIDKRICDGFEVVEEGSINTVTIKAGLCVVHISDKLAIHLRLASDYDFNTFTTPSGSDRTDYLYLDIYFDEIDSTEDANLINPARGQESAIDMRLVWSFEKSEGSAPGTPPTGHTYVSLAQIERQDGDPLIVTADITNLLEASLTVWDDFLVKGTSEFQDDITLSADKTIDGIDPSKLGRVVWAMDLYADYHSANAGTAVGWDTDCWWEVTTASANEVKLVCPHVKTPNMNKLRITAEVEETGGDSVLRFYAGASYTDIDIPGVINVETANIDISSMNDWDYYDIKVELRNGSGTCQVRKVVIYETYE